MLLPALTKLPVVTVYLEHPSCKGLKGERIKLVLPQGVSRDNLKTSIRNIRVSGVA